MAQQAGGDWQKGLFGCFGNCGLCVITYFVPCLTAGRVAEAAGKSCVVYGLLSICGPIGIYTRASVRSIIREQRGIEVHLGKSPYLLKIISMTSAMELLHLNISHSVNDNYTIMA